SPTTLLRGLPGRPIAVIFGAFVGVLEDFVCLTDVFKFILGAWGFVDIRMILTGQLTIGSLNLFLRCILCHSQDGIVIFEFHLAPPPTPWRMWAVASRMTTSIASWCPLPMGAGEGPQTPGKALTPAKTLSQ